MKETSMLLTKKKLGLILLVWFSSFILCASEDDIDLPSIGCFGLSQEKSQKLLEQIQTVIDRRAEILHEIEKVRYNLAVRKGYRPGRTYNGLEPGMKVVFNQYDGINKNLKTGIVQEVFSEEIVRVKYKSFSSRTIIVDSECLCKKFSDSSSYKIGDLVLFGKLKDRVGKIIEIFESNIVHIRDEETEEDFHIKDNFFSLLPQDGERVEKKSSIANVDSSVKSRELQLSQALEELPNKIERVLTAREAYELIDLLEEAFEALRLVEKKLKILEKELMGIVGYDKSESEITIGDKVLYTRKKVKFGSSENNDCYETLRDEAEILEVYDCGLVKISFSGKERKVQARNLSKKIRANKRFVQGDRVLMEGRARENGCRNLKVGVIKAVYVGRKYLVAFDSSIPGNAPRLDYVSNQKYQMTLIGS